MPRDVFNVFPFYCAAPTRNCSSSQKARRRPSRCPSAPQGIAKNLASRMGVSLHTLERLDAGDPLVTIGIMATELWLIGREEGFIQAAAPEHNSGALELDVEAAVAVGLERSRPYLIARIKRRYN